MKIYLWQKKMLSAIIGGLLVWASLSAESRTWTNADGKKVVGDQVGIDLVKQTVQLKMADGKTYNIPLGGLSKDDAALARAWKYPPNVSITYETKVFDGAVVQALIHVHNNSKSPHNYWVVCLFAPITKADSTGAETRELRYDDQLQKSTKLAANDSTDRDFADDKEEGFRPPGSPNLPPNPWLVRTDKTSVQDMAIVVVSKDDSNFTAIKAASPALEAYVKKNLKDILTKGPKEPESDPAP